ncbi:MAG: PLDc_N domain-containing protein, partial [Candidatus Dependentiae bacterium]|nr:PLDc_N domain-containing protein [Candidatus Dependentiae bacterium]
ISIISSSKLDLQNTVFEMIKNRNFWYYLRIYSIENKGIQFLDKNTIKFTGAFKIQEEMSLGNFSLELFSNYFIFQKNDDEWVLIDTDFCRKSDLKIIYLYMFGIISIFVFWVWMIIDCVHRDFNRRGLWLALIVFFNIVGALIYFFCIKIRQWKNKPTVSK